MGSEMCIRDSRYIIDQIDDKFELVFTGLDSTPLKEALDMNLDKVKTIMTINEVRALYDLQPLPNGDVILDNTYIQAYGGNDENI